MMDDMGKLVAPVRRELDSEEKIVIAIGDMEHVMEEIERLRALIQKEVYAFMPNDLFLNQWVAEDATSFAPIIYHTKFVRDQLLVLLHEKRGRKL
jgi:polysaccharide deacetylase 2 family uncharacterized protein YibQ